MQRVRQAWHWYPLCLLVSWGGSSPVCVRARCGAATAFYVATNGNDANPGTMGAPFGTLQRAAAAARGVSPRTPGSVVVYVSFGSHSPPTITPPPRHPPPRPHPPKCHPHVVHPPGRDPHCLSGTSEVGRTTWARPHYPSPARTPTSRGLHTPGTLQWSSLAPCWCPTPRGPPWGVASLLRLCPFRTLAETPGLPRWVPRALRWSCCGTTPAVCTCVTWECKPSLCCCCCCCYIVPGHVPWWGPPPPPPHTRPHLSILQRQGPAFCRGCFACVVVCPLAASGLEGGRPTPSGLLPVRQRRAPGQALHNFGLLGAPCVPLLPAALSGPLN
jgi:hypothetical protein